MKGLKESWWRNASIIIFSMESQQYLLFPKGIIFNDINNTKESVKFNDDLDLHYKNKRNCKAYQKM